MTLLSVTFDCKPKITLSNVIFGNVWDMQSASWQELNEQWERLRWARLRWQWPLIQDDNATAAAESLGIKAGTYRAYERNPNDGASKSIALPFDMARKIADKFGISWVWLLSGEGSPFDTIPTGPILRVNNAMRDLPKEAQEQVAEAILTLIKRDGTHG